jgi:histidyl-tRNA synthetase
MFTKAPKGTKDVLPDQLYKWTYVESVFRDFCARYGFKEIRTPVFEHTELFSRGVGQTTDIVQKQMYTFDDYAKRSLTLRPEGTAPVVRAFVEHKLYAEAQLSKYFYEIPCFRYEQPQSGRLREFHQFGVEIFGTANMMADADVIAIAYDFLTFVGIKKMRLCINSIGCPKCRKEYRAKLQDYLKPLYDELCDTCKTRFDKNPMRILDCKSLECRNMVDKAPRMLDYICEECAGDFAELKKNLDAYGIPYQIDPDIVRGLDYYTKTAFEFVSDSIGAQGTVCGGGRYDHLIEELGGPPITGVGFGLGIERLLLQLESEEVEIKKPSPPHAFIAYMGEEPRLAAMRLLKGLRDKGYRVEIDCSGKSFKGQMKSADRSGARYALIIGEDELAAGNVAVKDMTTGEQRLVTAEAAENGVVFDE